MIQFHISVSDGVNVGKSLVFGQNLEEPDSQWVEISKVVESLIEKTDLFGSNTSILCEKSESFRLGVKALKIHYVLVNHVECFLLGG